MKTGTRSGEIGGPLAESSFHGVGVNVVDGRGRKHIPIKTGSLLPKPKAGLAGPFHDREFVQLPLSIVGAYQRPLAEPVAHRAATSNSATRRSLAGM